MSINMLKFLVFTISLLAGKSLVSGITCPGRPSLLADYTTSCQTKSSSVNFAHSQSCLTHEIANNAKTCTPSGSCTEINVRLSAGQFRNSDKMVWSFAGCYTQSTSLVMCSDGYNLATTTVTTTTSTTTTPPTTTTGPTTATGPTTTTVPTTTTPPTSTTVTTTTETPSSEADDNTASSTTPASTTVNTATTPTLPEFIGCVSGIVALDMVTCAAHDVLSVAVDHFNDSNIDGTSNGNVNVDVKVLGCCATDNCRVDDQVTRSNTCKFGDISSTTSISCASACFAYLKVAGSTTTGQFGCLSDIDLIDTSFSAISDCSGTHQDGTCADANGETECLKCCTGSECNTWTTKDALLGTSPGGGSKASGLFSSGLLVIAALLVNKCL